MFINYFYNIYSKGYFKYSSAYTEAWRPFCGAHSVCGAHSGPAPPP